MAKFSLLIPTQHDDGPYPKRSTGSQRGKQIDIEFNKRKEDAETGEEVEVDACKSPLALPKMDTWQSNS